MDGALATTTRVSISTSDEELVLAYDQAGAGFDLLYVGSTATVQKSPLSSVNDELSLEFYRTGGLPPSSAITVWVEAATAAGATLATSYVFATGTTAAPELEDILWLTPRRCRVKFRDIMDSSASLTGTRYQVSIAGALEFSSPSTLRVSNTAPKPGWVGRYVSCTGSAYPTNNKTFTVIAANASSGTLTVDASPELHDDAGTDYWPDGSVARQRALRGYVTPYRLTPVIPGDGSACAYAPMPVSLRLPKTWELPHGENPNQYVIIDWHDDISYGRDYTISCVGPENLFGRAADGQSELAFTTPSFGRPETRLKLWDDVWSDRDREDDMGASSLFRRMSVVLQDILDVLWNRTDALADLTDAYRMPESVLDYTLYSEGNPLHFAMTTSQKRAVIAALGLMYQRAGTDKGIEDALALVLGSQFEVRELRGDLPWWILGTHRLGITTLLGPGTTYGENCYEVVSFQPLTELQRVIIKDIATTFDAQRMHLLRIVEPTTNVIVPLYWVLGLSTLGSSTTLTI
jgi:phage tail-like protein